MSSDAAVIEAEAIAMAISRAIEEIEQEHDMKEQNNNVSEEAAPMVVVPGMELAAALMAIHVAHATGELVIAKTAKGQFKGYAPLPDIHAIVYPALAKLGLTVDQIMGGDAETVSVQTIIKHIPTGQIHDGGTVVFSSRNLTVQQEGGAITYGRRYGLMTALGLSVSDDDGKAASVAMVGGELLERINKGLTMLESLDESEEANIYIEEKRAELEKGMTKKDGIELRKELLDLVAAAKEQAEE